MEKLRQCESIFIDITCISGTTIRTQELPRHTDISKHLPSTSVCCSVAQSCLTLCDPEDFSPPGSPVLHHLPEFAHTHVHWVTDAVQPSCPLSSPSPPAFYFSHHQGLFQWWCFPIRATALWETKTDYQNHKQKFYCFSSHADKILTLISPLHLTWFLPYWFSFTIVL